MSLVLTGTVALAYTAGVVGVHRYTVWRRRSKCGNYQALDWLDWDCLLAGMWPHSDQLTADVSCPEGGPAPQCLSARVAGRERARELLRDVVRGEAVESDDLEEAGFSGGEARWLEELSLRRRAPFEVLDRLEVRPAVSVAEAYFREWLALTYAVGPLTVEWHVFASKRRLRLAIRRFGDQPALYFARARASSLLGFSHTVLDDLARAVFFSRGASFYREAVLAMPFVWELRAPLARACQDARDRDGARLGTASEDHRPRVEDVF